MGELLHHQQVVTCWVCHLCPSLLDIRSLGLRQGGGSPRLGQLSFPRMGKLGLPIDLEPLKPGWQIYSHRGLPCLGHGPLSSHYCGQAGWTGAEDVRG